MQEVVDGLLIERGVLEQDATGHAAAVDDGSPVAVGIGRVGIKLLDGGQDGAPHHCLPCGGHMPRATFSKERHGTHEVEGLYGAERGVVAVEALQRGGIGIGNAARLLGIVLPFGGLLGRSSPAGRGECCSHVLLAAGLRAAILSVAGHHLVRAGHLVFGLCVECRQGPRCQGKYEEEDLIHGSREGVV